MTVHIRVMMFCSLTVYFNFVFCFSWSKRTEAPSPHLDKFSPNANWPETWRRLMTGVWLNTVQTVIIVLFITFSHHAEGILFIQLIMYVFAVFVQLVWCDYILTTGSRSASVYHTRSTGLVATISPLSH